MEKSTDLVTIYLPDNDYLRSVPNNKNDKRAKMLGIFLEDDVQSSDYSANAYLKDLEEVTSGRTTYVDSGVANL